MAFELHGRPGCIDDEQWLRAFDIGIHVNRAVSAGSI